MATELKRFTISITPNMEVELNHAKKEKYYNITQNGMIQDLIIRGLKSLETQKRYETVGLENHVGNPVIDKTASV